MRETDSVIASGESHLSPGVLRDGELELELLEFAAPTVHTVPTYHFRMVHAERRTLIGSIDLRVATSRHIEYWAGHVGCTVLASHRGNRYAGRGLLLLSSFAARLCIDPLWITCDPENIPSRRAIEFAGAELVEIVGDGPLQKCRYRLSAMPG